jgi:hypothetical protein
MAGNPAPADMPRYDASHLPQGAIVEIVDHSPVRLDQANPTVTVFQQEVPASPVAGPSAAPSIAPEVSPTPNPVTGEVPCPTPTPEPTPVDPIRTIDPNIGQVSDEALAQGQVTTDVLPQAEPSAAPSNDIFASPAPSEDPQTALNCPTPVPSLQPTPEVTPRPELKDIEKLITERKHKERSIEDVGADILKAFEEHPEDLPAFMAAWGFEPEKLVEDCIKAKRDEVKVGDCSQVSESLWHTYALTREDRYYKLLDKWIDAQFSDPAVNPEVLEEYLLERYQLYREDFPLFYS